MGENAGVWTLHFLIMPSLIAVGMVIILLGLLFMARKFIPNFISIFVVLLGAVLVVAGVFAARLDYLMRLTCRNE